MKNKILFLLVIFAAFLLTVSCEKEKQTVVITKVINVNLNENESYRYAIPPSGDKDDAMQLSQDAKHAITSKITTDDLQNTLFEYIPSINYVGSDEVRVTTVEGEHKHGKGDNHDGNCNHNDTETETNYIFKINVIKTIFP